MTWNRTIEDDCRRLAKDDGRQMTEEGKDRSVSQVSRAGGVDSEVWIVTAYKVCADDWMQVQCVSIQVTANNLILVIFIFYFTLVYLNYQKYI